MAARSPGRRRTVVVADANLRVAVLLAELLEDECDLHVVGTCSDAAGAVALVQQHRPDLVLVAEHLGASSGTTLCRVVRLVSPDTALVLRFDTAAPSSPAPALADAVVPRDATFRRLARGLYDAATHARLDSAPAVEQARAFQPALRNSSAARSKSCWRSTGTQCPQRL